MTPLLLAVVLTAVPPKAPVQRYDFSDDVLTGKRKTPEIDIYVSRKPAIFPRLIKVRENFDDKIISSVNQM